MATRLHSLLRDRTQIGGVNMLSRFGFLRCRSAYALMSVATISVFAACTDEGESETATVESDFGGGGALCPSYTKDPGKSDQTTNSGAILITNSNPRLLDILW